MPAGPSGDPDLFPGFRRSRIRAGEVAICARTGGSGPPLLLLHGHPQTQAIWHLVAPRLAARFSVVLADLRGCGDSDRPPSAPDHAPYSKREMARDQVLLMEALGHRRFGVVGHDRGGRVAHRMALDFPAAVSRLAVLDIAPTLVMVEQAGLEFAREYWHWFFLIQPEPLPERMLGADPELYLRTRMRRSSQGRWPIADAAFAEYLRCFREPGAIHAACEDYRASAGIDLEHDRADREAGRKVSCPLLALWGERGLVHRLYRPLEEWRRFCSAGVEGRPLPCGHYLPEELPGETAEELLRFFG